MTTDILFEHFDAVSIESRIAKRDLFNRVECSYRDEAQKHESLSWEDAQEEAGKWIGELRLGRNLKGQTVDLREHAKRLPFEGVFRTMVLRAAKRKLEKRGADTIIMPLEE